MFMINHKFIIQKKKLESFLKNNKEKLEDVKKMM